MAVWEKEGWGTTNDCLQMVVDNYKTQGTTDRHSVYALESYLRRLTPPAFKVMFEHSRTTTAQMIADVLGVDKLLDVYNVFMQEPGNTENARELRERIERLEQQNRNLAKDLSEQREKLEFFGIIPYNYFTVSLCITKATVWEYSHTVVCVRRILV